VRSHTFQYRIVIMLILASLLLAGCGLLDAGTETPTSPIETEEPPTQAPPTEEPTPTDTVPPEPTATEEAPTETAIAWYGRVISLHDGQFDDYLSVYPEGAIEIGIEGETAAIEEQIVDLRDHAEPGRNAHFWGTLHCPTVDYGGCQLRVTRLRVDGPGPFFDPDPVEEWVGTITTGITEPGSGGDDYFQLDGEFAIQYGIDGTSDPSGDLARQVEYFRHTGSKVRIWGSLMAGIPDWNATQIQISRIEAYGDSPPEPGTLAVAWYGRVASLPLASQFDDLISIYPEGTAQIGIEGTLDQLEQRIIDLRDAPEPGNNAHFWGILICPAVDYGGCQLRVESIRLDTAGRIFEPNEVDGWIGTIHTGRTEPGSGGDDYFQLEGEFPIQYGVWASSDPSGAIADQIEGLRDTGTRIRVWGWLVAGIPDWNATQLQVNRFEIVP